jgi:outer membrane lipoprotein LolB
MKPWLLLAASLTLSACASLGPGAAPTGSPQERWQERRSALEQIDRFTLHARVAGSGALGMKGDLRWQQQADGRFDLRVAGPFGAGAVGISGDAQAVQVRTREGTEVTTDPERWLRQRLGWSLPIGGLRYWALGLPAPHSPAHIELDAAGALAALEQDGWRLQYDEYQSAGLLDLPRRFQLQHGDATIKVVADRWEDLPGSPAAP